MKNLIIIFICVLWLIALAYISQKKADDAYHRGYVDGVNSSSKKITDTEAIQWFFNSNLKEAKKAICN